MQLICFWPTHYFYKHIQISMYYTVLKDKTPTICHIYNRIWSYAKAMYEKNCVAKKCQQWHCVNYRPRLYIMGTGVERHITIGSNRQPTFKFDGWRWWCFVLYSFVLNCRGGWNKMGGWAKLAKIWWIFFLNIVNRGYKVSYCGETS